MTTESKTVAIVPLNETNYPTWKVQCQIALVRDGLWGIAAGTETEPPVEEANRRSKFLMNRNCALATIVLAVDPALLHLIGDPEDPVAVWKKLRDQFQKKTWTNKLALRRRLHSLQLREGDPAQDHIKAMTELFNEMAIFGDVIEEENHVVYLLGSLPDSFNTLITALKANKDIPKMKIVTEWLLHAERKQKEKASIDLSRQKAIILKFKGHRPRYHYCKKIGHIQKNCFKHIEAEKRAEQDGSVTSKGKKRDSNIRL